jgi:RTX calcium-binding nonapeptide repeat (4 copies)
MQLIRMPLAERQAFMPLTYDTDFLDDGHDDIIVGTRGNDTLYGGGGDDEIWGVAGADVIDGGSGDDIIWSGTPKYDDTAADWGGDELDGGTGNDQILAASTTILSKAATGWMHYMAGVARTQFTAATIPTGSWAKKVATSSTVTADQTSCMVDPAPTCFGVDKAVIGSMADPTLILS